MSLSARTLHRLASVLGRSSAADIEAALSGGGASAYGPPIEWSLEGSVLNGGDDFAAAQKLHLPTDAKLYLVSAMFTPPGGDANQAVNGSLVAIENAAHWDHWWGDGSNFDYPTAAAVSSDVIWPGGLTDRFVRLPVSVIVAGGWYVVPFHEVAIQTVTPIA